jgi:hypothetical protein
MGGIKTLWGISAEYVENSIGYLRRLNVAGLHPVTI